MPDKRSHRGKHPDDDRLFAAASHEVLRAAVADLSWLLTRGYAWVSGLKIVGDRYGLTARQRLAVRRSACSDQALGHRRATSATLQTCRGRSLGIDGYNLLITVESALSGGLILIGRDGCYRDLASIHRTYRKVEETIPAMAMILEHLAQTGAARIDWYLDRPVSNSGRLKTLIAETLEGYAGACGGLGDRDGLSDQGDLASRGGAPVWNIELVKSPDAILKTYRGPVVTTDSAILDERKACDEDDARPCAEGAVAAGKAPGHERETAVGGRDTAGRDAAGYVASFGGWINLAADLIEKRVPAAWKVDLRSL